MRLHSASTKILLIVIPLLVILATTLLFLFVHTTTDLYNERFNLRQERELAYARFAVQTYAQELTHTAKAIANLRAVGESLLDSDPDGAATALAEQMGAKGIDLSFILPAVNTYDTAWPPTSRAVRGHNRLRTTPVADSMLLKRLWSRLHQDLITGTGKIAIAFFHIDREELAEELADVLPGDQQAKIQNDVLVAVATPVRSFQNVVGYIILASSLSKNQVLQNRLRQSVDEATTRHESIVLQFGKSPIITVGNLPVIQNLLPDNTSTSQTSEDIYFETHMARKFVTGVFSTLDPHESIRIGIVSDRGDLENAIATVTKQTMVTAVLMTLFIIVAVATAIRIVLNPLNSLKLASVALANGDYSARAQIGANDEIGAVANRFNLMAEAIERHMQRLADLVTQGRYIASQISLHGVLRSAKTALNRIVQEKVSVDILFSEACFSGDVLSPGFYPIDDLGKPMSANREGFDTLQARDGSLLLVRDTRSSLPLAALVVTHPDPAITKEAMQILEPATNHIASAITTVRLERALDDLQKLTRQIRTIFTNINQGILIVDHRLRVQPEYSDHCKIIFEKEDLSGEHIIDLLANKTDLPSDRRAEVDSCLTSSFDLDILTYQLNSSFLPKQIVVQGQRVRQYEVDWIPLVNEHDYVTYIMITLRDVTEMLILRDKEEAAEKEMQLVREIVSATQDNYDLLMTTLTQHVESCKQILTQSGEISSDDIRKIRHYFHTIKGDSNSLGFSSLKRLAHDCETDLQEVMSYAEPNVGWKDKRVNELVERIANALTNYARISEERLNRTSDLQKKRTLVIRSVVNISRSLLQEKGLSHDNHATLANMHRMLVETEYQTLASLVRNVQTSITNIAANLGRPHPEISLSESGNWAVSDRAGSALFSVLSHLCRNSFDHGFTHDMQHRRITINPIKESDYLDILYRDNGRGVNLVRLAQVCASRGKDTNGLSDEDLAASIFATGFTTAKRITDISGRGVGMDAAQRLMTDIGGDLFLEFSGPREVDGFRPIQLRIRIHSIDIIDKL